MTRCTAAIAGAFLLLASSAVAPALAQGAKQIVPLAEVNPLVLATGYRSSKLVGSEVYNDSMEDIGKVDDLIVTAKDNVPFVVLSVGSFLGVDKHYVVVPASSLEVINGRITLSAGSKASLESLPSYKYTY
jgi:sporulation protein YlmC with PRC-barrel domain